MKSFIFASLFVFTSPIFADKDETGAFSYPFNLKDHSICHSVNTKLETELKSDGTARFSYEINDSEEVNSVFLSKTSIYLDGSYYDVMFRSLDSMYPYRNGNKATIVGTVTPERSFLSHLRKGLFTENSTLSFHVPYSINFKDGSFENCVLVYTLKAQKNEHGQYGFPESITHGTLSDKYLSEERYENLSSERSKSLKRKTIISK